MADRQSSMPICFLFSGYSKKTYESPLSDNYNDVDIKLFYRRFLIAKKNVLSITIPRARSIARGVPAQIGLGSHSYAPVRVFIRLCKHTLHSPGNHPTLCQLPGPTPIHPASPRRLNQGRARLVTPIFIETKPEILKL